MGKNGKRSLMSGTITSLGSWSGNGTTSRESLAVLEDRTAPLALKKS